MPAECQERFVLPPKPEKLELIEIAHELTKFRSFADLGACWGVNGAYGFHAAKVCGDALERAVIVDAFVTPLTIETADAHPKVEVVSALLGSRQALDAVGRVDALIMYDILLHQVRPDWDDFLLKWLPHAGVLILFNQNWLGSARTIRFVDRGLDWYSRNVHVWEDDVNNRAGLKAWFDKHDRLDEWGRRLRDSHHYWQWGIRPLDLVRLLARGGFELIYMKRYPFGSGTPWIVNDAMVFQRAAFPEPNLRRWLATAIRRLAKGV